MSDPIKPLAVGTDMTLSGEIKDGPAIYAVDGFIRPINGRVLDGWLNRGVIKHDAVGPYFHVTKAAKLPKPKKSLSDFVEAKRKKKKLDKLARAVIKNEEEAKRKKQAEVEAVMAEQAARDAAKDAAHETGDEPEEDPKPDKRFFEAAIGPRGAVVYTFRSAWLGRFLNQLSPIKPGLDGRLYRYRDGTWLPNGDRWIDAMTRHLLGKFFSKHLQDETVTWLRSTHQLETRPSLRYLNLPNGMLDWRTGELHPHSIELSSMIRIPVEWHPDAKCPKIEKFLHEVLLPDCIEFIEEIAGYALYPENRFQKALLLSGPGGNGKGTLLDIFHALLGDANVSSQTLHALGEDRFAVADLYGKLANICGDLDARSVERSDIFKMITGRDKVNGQHKFKDGFKFLAFCLLMFSANETPPSSDQTDGYFDRWLVVPMERRIRDTPMEVQNLIEQLATKEELEGFLVVAVEGLRRLMKRGYIEIPASVRAAGKEMREDLDTVGGFVRDCCQLGPDLWMPKADWYKGYTLWCAQNGRKAFSSTRAYKQLASIYKDAIDGSEAARRNTARGFKGIGPGSEFPEDDKARGRETDEMSKPLSHIREHVLDFLNGATVHGKSFTVIEASLWRVSDEKKRAKLNAVLTSLKAEGLIEQVHDFGTAALFRLKVPQELAS
jgi:P4 family phage/plasmid primase-like protien